jgi:hypothetical protein
MPTDKPIRPFDVEAALNGLPLVEAPDLKGPVLAKLAGRRPAPRRNFPRLRTGLLLSCAAALLLVVLTRQAGPLRSGIAGTLAPQGAAAWPLVHRWAGAEGAVSVRRQGDHFAFCLEATGPGTPSLHWDPVRWERLPSGDNPIILRHLSGSGGVSLRVDGHDVMTLPLGPE